MRKGVLILTLLITCMWVFRQKQRCKSVGLQGETKAMIGAHNTEKESGIYPMEIKLAGRVKTIGVTQ